MKNFKVKAVIAVFLLIVFGLTALHIALPDGALSYSERRALQQLPTVTLDKILDGDFSQELEDYFLDQFPGRDLFRYLKAFFSTKILLKQDNNGYYEYDGGIYKIDYPLYENRVNYAVSRINYVIEKYLTDNNVYLSIVPDKNYFVAENAGYLSIDYDKLVETVKAGVGSAQYIDIFGALSEQDYYATDTHWRQELILDVRDILADAMGTGGLVPTADRYTVNTLEGFSGVYAGQSGFPGGTETLSYLTNGYILNSTVTSFEDGVASSVYALEKYDGMDPYDIYLSGAVSVLTIETPDAASDRELIIFRDSFGGSIAPLLVGAYSKITLVDIRYISSDMLGEYVDFENADVLFLYCTSLLNSGNLLK